MTIDPNSCLGPHLCRGGCGRRIDSREFSCAACWLTLPSRLKVAAWSMWDHAPRLVYGADGLLEAAEQAFRKRTPHLEPQAEQVNPRS